MYRRNSIRPAAVIFILLGISLIILILSRCGRSTPFELKGTVSQIGDHSFTLVVNPIQNFSDGDTIIVMVTSNTNILDYNKGTDFSHLKNGKYVTVRFNNRKFTGSKPLEAPAEQITVLR